MISPKATGEVALAALIKSIFTEGVSTENAKRRLYCLQEYSQKAYLGKPFGMPDLKAGHSQIDGTSYFRFKNPKDDKYYDEKVVDLQKSFLFKFL